MNVLSGNGYIPLNLEPRQTDNFIRLCNQYYKKWSLWHYINKKEVNTYEPKVEIRRMSFRRVNVPYGPIWIQVIRCTEYCAIIESGNKGSRYLLEKNVPNEGSEDVPIFYIYTSFFYDEEPEEIPDLEMGTSVSHDVSRSSHTHLQTSDNRLKASTFQGLKDSTRTKTSHIA